MTTQKQPDTALAPYTSSGRIVSAKDTGGLTRGEQRVIEEWRTQQAVIDAQAKKTIYAERVFSEMTAYTHDIGISTLQHIEATQAQTQSQTVRAFCEREKQLYAYQALELLSTGGELLHQEVSRTLYPPPRRKLFGR
jgi:hypothetical protein